MHPTFSKRESRAAAVLHCVYVCCVDKVLEQFSQQQGVWRYCTHFMQHSKNQHVLMYSLNLIEVSALDINSPFPRLIAVVAIYYFYFFSLGRIR